MELTKTIVPLTAEQLQEKADAKAAEARQERDALLASCDWTQTADAPVDQVDWQDYRQALRDIPQQAGFPTDITWPTKPE